MNGSSGRVRVLYSFPLRLGAERICTTAWHQVNGLAEAGADVLVFPASISRAVAGGRERIPHAERGRVAPSVPDRGRHPCRCFARSYCGSPARETRGKDRHHSYLAARSTRNAQNGEEVGNPYSSRKVQCPHRLCYGGCPERVRALRSDTAGRS